MSGDVFLAFPSAWTIVDIKKSAEGCVPLAAPERRLLGCARLTQALKAYLIDVSQKSSSSVVR